MHRIVIIGPPASGKGTQCRRIQNLLDIETLGTGMLLRNEVKSRSKLGGEVEKFLNAGAYVPDALIMDLVQAWILNRRGQGWVLDGFPRTIAQAEALEYDPSYQPPSMAIALDVPKSVLEKRITSRRECPECGITISVDSEYEKMCHHCNGMLISRADDDLNNFRRRFDNYMNLTYPLFDFYEKKDKLLFVNGSASMDAVFKTISKHIA